MKTRWLGAAALALVAAACAKDSVEPAGDGAMLLEAQAGDTVRLVVGQAARVGDIAVTFRGVGEDSRCPIDALCVWPGSAEALLDVAVGSGTPVRVGLHTFSEPRSADFGQYTVKVAYVEPAQQSDRAIDPATYSVRLAISRR